LADWAEACVIAPATANIMAKIAHGLADDLLSTTVLAIEAPLLLAPAMNDRMWHKAAVQENVARLGKWGYHFVGPAEGRLACGTVGQGRMAEPEEIISALESLLKLGARMTQAVRKKKTKRKRGGKRP
ncbi:MAG: bifunctional 4'-phosphopantothenoylcysteine decarboxylase/phosphopantothenoylcysteine synthetase, partial [Anaerolineaceae bacterium]|nr:bifunctional 4'-phosphopantothenoylcysteine decarboxylase/phosphopantothenoylcysteine synthetase [Anaerolineaceae bacterium]